MSRQPIFAGLVIDENDNPVATAYIGEEPCYVVNDAGFRRHIPAEQVDRQVLEFIKAGIKGHEDAISEQTSKMLGQDDIFSRAMILKQLKQIDQQFDNLFQTGIPTEARAYLGMMGMRIVINLHGDVIRVDQPSTAASDEDEGPE
jgi:hypothetical protein